MNILCKRKKLKKKIATQLNNKISEIDLKQKITQTIRGNAAKMSKQVCYRRITKNN